MFILAKEGCIEDSSYKRFVIIVDSHVDPTSDLLRFRAEHHAKVIFGPFWGDTGFRVGTFHADRYFQVIFNLNMKLVSIVQTKEIHRRRKRSPNYLLVMRSPKT